MKKTFVILISLTIFISCVENKKQPVAEIEDSNLENEYVEFDPIKYVSNPEKTDTLCISEINRAKDEIKTNGIAFTQEVGFLYGHNRYEKELEALCKQNGLNYEIDLIGCVVFEGQTQGCYGAYMDKVLADKYGLDFKQQMHKKADSLFLQNVIKNNLAVYYGDCDERPKLPSEKNRNSDYIPNVKVENLEIEEDKSEYGGWPFFDVGFTVERDSTINSFYINYFFEGLESNKKYKNELFELAKNHLKKNYPTWVPGIVNGTQVRTDNNVRIHLIKE
ncbi:hypothetical protein [Maribacter halichondriae]|uniref:hypothetical protein n=1 Tax=Maribacter halichondriae TaxID=2980554 RepID=UPI0023581E8B|nr:hypothetical protein [Maribacter sp. Hal144]